VSIEAYNHYSDLGLACGFQVRAKSEDEIIEYAVAHVARAHGMKGMLGNGIY
jgi:predicted small metal-binding protein